MKLDAINPSIGDKVVVFLDKKNEVSSVSTAVSIPTTILGIYYAPNNTPALYLIGWKAGYPMANDSRMAPASSFISSPHTNAFKFLPDKHLYDQAMWCPSHYEATGLAIPKSSVSSVGATNIPLHDDAKSKIRSETKCKNKTCGSTVFTDDSSCWNCSVSNPGRP